MSRGWGRRKNSMMPLFLKCENVAHCQGHPTFDIATQCHHLQSSHSKAAQPKRSHRGKCHVLYKCMLLYYPTFTATLCFRLDMSEWICKYLSNWTQKLCVLLYVYICQRIKIWLKIFTFLFTMCIFLFLCTLRIAIWLALTTEVPHLSAGSWNRVLVNKQPPSYSPHPCQYGLNKHNLSSGLKDCLQIPAHALVQFPWKHNQASLLEESTEQQPSCLSSGPR